MDSHRKWDGPYTSFFLALPTLLQPFSFHDNNLTSRCLCCEFYMNRQISYGSKRHWPKATFYAEY